MNPFVPRGPTAAGRTRLRTILVLVLVLVPGAALGGVGCVVDGSPSAPPGGQIAPATHDAAPLAADDAANPAEGEDDTQWSYVYDRYFAAGTAGHCGNSGCHARPQAGFACGSTASSCFDGLVAAGLVDLAHPPSSRLGDAASTPLAWFGSGYRPGKMPADEAVENQDAARAVTRWLAAGAKHGGGHADAGTDPSGPDASVHDASAPDGAAPADAGSRDAHADGPPPPPAMTWTKLYTGYFGPGTPGHCGNSGCHGATRAGFSCGATKTSCFSGLVAAGLVSPASPSSSRLGDPLQSPLAWFGGPMPKDNAVANPAAAQAVTAWLTAGAHND